MNPVNPVNPGEPTNEQLARFALVLAFGPGQSESEVATTVGFFEASPGFREEWLRRHREFQEAISTEDA